MATVSRNAEKSQIQKFTLLQFNKKQQPEDPDYSDSICLSFDYRLLGKGNLPISFLQSHVLYKKNLRGC